MSRASSGSSSPRWVNQRTTRRRTWAVMDATASGVRAAAWRNWTPPVAGGSNTPCQGYKLVV